MEIHPLAVLTLKYQEAVRSHNVYDNRYGEMLDKAILRNYYHRVPNVHGWYTTSIAHGLVDIVQVTDSEIEDKFTKDWIDLQKYKKFLKDVKVAAYPAAYGKPDPDLVLNFYPGVKYFKANEFAAICFKYTETIPNENLN